MPLSDDDLRDVQGRVLAMFMDTIRSLELLEQHAGDLFGDNSTSIQAAIREYLTDFIRDPSRSGEIHPEVLIYRTSTQAFQRAGLYGAQLNVKERHVTQANSELRHSLTQRAALKLFRSPFKKWVDRVNNFLRSIASATGISEALMELKDCLRDELHKDSE